MNKIFFIFIFSINLFATDYKMFLDGEKESNENKEIFYLNKCIKNKNPLCLLELSKRKEFGQNTEKNQEQSLEYLKEAFLEIQKEKDDDIKKIKMETAFNFVSEISNGYKTGQYIYKNKIIKIDKNEERYFLYLKLLADEGSLKNSFYLAEKYKEKKEFSLALIYYKKDIKNNMKEINKLCKEQIEELSTICSLMIEKNELEWWNN